MLRLVIDATDNGYVVNHYAMSFLEPGKRKIAATEQDALALVASALGIPDAPDTEQKWQYLKRELGLEEATQGDLNHFGLIGWELVWMGGPPTESRYCIFKRPLKKREIESSLDERALDSISFLSAIVMRHEPAFDETEYRLILKHLDMLHALATGAGEK